MNTTALISNKDRPGVQVLDSFIDAIDWDECTQRIIGWGIKHESRYICLCNAHSLVTASRNEAFRKAINNADMATPDGAPVAWMLRRLGFPEQKRINGPDLMWEYCVVAEQSCCKIFLFGSRPETLEQLIKRLRSTFPRIYICGALSPPFRPLTQEEDRAMVDTINDSNPEVVFVALGCPKQELWMAEHRGRINAVMIGVGAAFDFHSGTLRRAPRWMQSAGLEWMFRLCMEPARLWKRYLVTNSIFLYKAARQLINTSAPAKKAKNL